MFPPIVMAADGGPQIPITLFYTGKNINATNGSRTADTTYPLLPGEVLVADPYGWDKGRGVDLAIPTTGFLAGQCYLVVDVPWDSRFGGPVTVVPWNPGASAYVASGSATTVGVTMLGPVDGKRCLAVQAGSVASAATNLAALGNVAAVADETVGSVATTVTSLGGTQALVKTQFGRRIL